MKDRIRFHLDESVNLRIARGLEAMGIDITTPKQVGLRGAEDIRHWEFAQQAQRVLITHDSDFLRIAARDWNHAGLIFCTQEGHSVGGMIVECASINANCSVEEMKGRIEFI